MGASVSNPNFDEPAKDSGTGAAVLIADDDPAIRLVLRHRLEADGLRVEEAADSAAALAAIRANRFDVALLDIIMPGAGGLEVLSAAQAEGVRTLIIVMTAASTMNNAVEAMKRGAHDYLTKPFANLDLVAAAVEARGRSQSRRPPSLNRLKDEVNRQLVGGEIIGRSPAMQEVYKLIGRVVTNDATVLLSGESGTGKELVARAIHFKSARWRSPFVAVNCSAIPQGLLESELFGHERGSFTGATERRAGKFEMADGGTHLPRRDRRPAARAAAQAAAGPAGARVQPGRQRRDVEAQGARDRGDQPGSRDAGRAAQVPRGPVLPPPRDSDPDAAAARTPRRHRRAGRIISSSKAAHEMGARANALSPEARAKLEGFDWPGNVRELENAVMRAALLAPGTTIRADDIELHAGPAESARGAERRSDGAALAEIIAGRIGQWLDAADGSEPRDLYDRLVAEIEKPLIELALRRTGGNQVKAARMLGLNRNTLRKKITDHKIALTKYPRRMK